MSADCVFCRIIAGDLPSVKVFEDKDCLAIMDITPMTKGHTLVIPKRHCELLGDVPAALLRSLMLGVQAIVRAQTAGLGAAGVNVTQANGREAGQTVPHVHFHVIPRLRGDEHSWNNPQRKYDTADEMEHIASRIRDALPAC